MGRRIGGKGGGSDPGPGKKTGRVVAAAALVGVVGVTSGTVSLGGSAAIEGAVADSGANAVAGRGLNSRKADSKRSAGRGRPDEAWQRLGLRGMRKTAKRDASCLIHSHGEIREFFLRTPCTSLDRQLLAIGDGNGNTALVSVVWVSFRSRGQARDFERLEKIHGNGDITPLAASLIQMADVRFTAHHFDSRLAGNTVVIAESERATGQVSEAVLDALAEVAVHLPRA
ncbi:hypothetical protein [Amycolatopsis tucumanensis]|uniref:Secreted protein n=1 Tax=Amycolatopsis tucumanensis TaxID=401106 RepID=A0ABP7IXZ1_9PSEU|nr:hypothetical protein [Amycolatopsis tucumanensis]MCF6423363.1 hypothetical protein [Amycolatopsis tucumanensis]